MSGCVNERMCGFFDEGIWLPKVNATHELYLLWAKGKFFLYQKIQTVVVDQIGLTRIPTNKINETSDNLS